MHASVVVGSAGRAALSLDLASFRPAGHGFFQAVPRKTPKGSFMVRPCFRKLSIRPFPGLLYCPCRFLRKVQTSTDHSIRWVRGSRKSCSCRLNSSVPFSALTARQMSCRPSDDRNNSGRVQNFPSGTWGTPFQRNHPVWWSAPQTLHCRPGI